MGTKIEDLNKKVEKYSLDGFTYEELEKISKILNNLENKNKFDKETIIKSIADDIIKQFDSLPKEESKWTSINWHDYNLQIDLIGPNSDINIKKGDAKLLNKLREIGITAEMIANEIKEKRPDIEVNNNFVEEIGKWLKKTLKALDEVGI